MSSSIILIFLSLLLAVRGDLEDTFKNEILGMNSSISGMGQCGKDLIKIALELGKKEGNKAFWPLEMLDATSKIRSGLALLSDDIGQFDECLGVVSDNGEIKGKYCLGSLIIRLPSREHHQLHEIKKSLKKKAAALTRTSLSHPITWAGCLPSSCSSENFAYIFSNILGKITAGTIEVAFDESSCYTVDEDTELTTGAKITIVFFSVICLLMILSTCYDIYYQHNSKAPNGYLLAFSMYTNSKKLLAVSQNNNQLECLNGLKFFSMLWVVLGHTYSQAISGPLYNYMDISTWADKLHSMLLISGTLSVDTFFVVGGALVTYVYMQSIEKGKKFNIIIYYLHRYIRLTPALAALVLVVATVYPYLGSGPYWVTVRQNQKMCQDVWWTSLLYIQNYEEQRGICAGHSWYLAVDMQLYILSPIILYLLRKYPKHTILGLVAVILGICGMNFGLAWSNNYLAILSNIYGDNVDFMAHFYIKTHTRANTWLTGVLIGVLIHQIKQKKISFRLNKFLILVVWIFVLALFYTCVFIGHDFLRTPDYQQWGNSLHIAFWRQSWALGIGWVMVACISGYGGLMNWFLSLPAYQVFNRFAYSIYLVHYMLITLWSASTRSPLFFSDLMMGYYFWGHLCFTCIISYFWVLAFESPVIILEKLILAPLMK